MSHAPSADGAAATPSLSPARSRARVVVPVCVLAGLGLGLTVWTAVGQPMPLWAAVLVAVVITVCAAVPMVVVSRSRPAEMTSAATGENTEADSPGEQGELDPRLWLPLAARLESLVLRQTSTVNALEREVEDPELLSPLYEVDHLNAQQRRMVETLAVFAGEPVHRSAREALWIRAVVMAAIAEIPLYGQVQQDRIAEVRIAREAHGDLRHTLAELLDNATGASDPDGEPVLVRAAMVPAGLMIQIRDAGLAPAAEDFARHNAVLADRVDLREALADGRYGLAAVSTIAGRRGFTVRLEPNLLGGTDAIVVVPDRWLVTDTDTPVRTTPAPRHASDGGDETTQHLRLPHRITGDLATETALPQRTRRAAPPAPAVSPEHPPPPAPPSPDPDGRRPLPRRQPGRVRGAVPTAPRPAPPPASSGGAGTAFDPAEIGEIADLLGGQSSAATPAPLSSSFPAQEQP